MVPQPGNVFIGLETQGLFTWSEGPRSSGVSFFCFHALGDTKQKKLTPLDRGPPLHVNRVSVREKTNKHPRQNFAQPFFSKFSCVLQSSQEKLKTLLTLTIFCLGKENGGDKQVLLMIQRRLAGVRFSVPLKTLSLHVFFFNAFLFLVCPFWSGVGYDFRGNYGSG